MCEFLLASRKLFSRNWSGFAHKFQMWAQRTHKLRIARARVKKEDMLQCMWKVKRISNTHTHFTFDILFMHVEKESPPSNEVLCVCVCVTQTLQYLFKPNSKCKYQSSFWWCVSIEPFPPPSRRGPSECSSQFIEIAKLWLELRASSLVLSSIFQATRLRILYNPSNKCQSWSTFIKYVELNNNIDRM